MAVSAYASKQVDKVTHKVSDKATQMTQNVSEKATEMTQNASDAGMAIAEEASVLNPFVQMANSIGQDLEQDCIRREANEDADWEQQVQKNGLDPKSIDDPKMSDREKLLAEMDAQIAAKAEEEKRKNAEFEDDILNHRKMNGKSYC